MTYVPIIIATLALAVAPMPAHGLKGIVEGPASVRDGDTVFVKGKGDRQWEVRLKGVDAMEQSTPHGRDATEAMRVIVGDWLRCRLTGEKTHNREVGYCTNAAGQDIGQEIVTRGIALACPYYSERYVDFEQPEAVKRLVRASYCFVGPPKPRRLTAMVSADPSALLLATPETSYRPQRRAVKCNHPNDRDSIGRRCGKRAKRVGNRE